MADPISTPLLTKLMSGLGGLAGGVSFMVFYRPVNVWDAAVRSGLSVLSAIVFAPILLEWMSWLPSSDNLIAASVVVGFCSWSLLSLLAHTMMGLQDDKVNISLSSFSLGKYKDQSKKD